MHKSGSADGLLRKEKKRKQNCTLANKPPKTCGKNDPPYWFVNE